MIRLHLTHEETPDDVIQLAYKFGKLCYNTGGIPQYKAIQSIQGLFIFIAKEINGIVSVKVVSVNVGIVTAPRDINTAVFPLTSKVSTQVSSEINTCKPLTTAQAIKETDIVRGNYHVALSCDVVYSITAPIHHLANDWKDSEVPSFTRYAWTSNNSQKDVYTTFSDSVYLGGEVAYTGTLAAPESSFKTGAIVGIGINSSTKKVHLAQLVYIPKDFGYWSISDKNNNELGIFFGDVNACKKLIENTENTYKSVWVNDTKALWWYEFFEAIENIGKVTPKLAIYDRKVGTRLGSATQWFYINDSWVQYSKTITSKLKFDGLKNNGGLYNTKYSLTASTWNNKALVLQHTAISDSGALGVHKEKEYDIYRETNIDIPYLSSGDMTLSGNYTIFGPVDPCNRISVSAPSPYNVITIKDGIQYKVLMPPDNDPCAAMTISGNIVAESQYNSVSIPVNKVGTVPSITVSASGTGLAGSLQVNDTITASGGVSPYTFVISAGGINNTTGVITSLPSCPIATGTVVVTDACGKSASKGVRFAVPTANWRVTECDANPNLGSNCSAGSVYDTETSDTRRTVRYVDITTEAYPDTWQAHWFHWRFEPDMNCNCGEACWAAGAGANVTGYYGWEAKWLIFINLHNHSAGGYLAGQNDCYNYYGARPPALQRASYWRVTHIDTEEWSCP